MRTIPYLLLVALVGLSCSSSVSVEEQPVETADNNPVEWLTSFEEAKRAAAERKLPILADFSGSDWCGWCIKLDREVFSTSEFKEYARDNLVLLLVDFPSGKEQPEELKNRNRALAEKYEVEGFPTVLLLDPDGKVMARTGYRQGGAAKYVEHLRESS